MSDPAEQKQAQWEKVLAAVLGYQATWIADIGLRSGLFRAVAEAGERGTTAAQLASRLGFDRRYVEVWCRSAYAFEWLDGDEAAGYRLPPGLAPVLLDPADPQFQGGRVQFQAALYEDFRAYPEYLRRGGTWPRSAHDPWLLEALKNASKPDAGVLADVVAAHLPEVESRLRAGGALLDVGAGGGHALIEYARRYPAARVVGLDPDQPSVALARRAVAEAGLQGCVEVVEQDANHLDQEARYDLVTLNIALHETGEPAEYRNVLDRVRRALRPGGAVVVSELPYPDRLADYRTRPVYRLLAGVQLHEAIVGCGAITQGELRALLEGAGFARVRAVEQPLPMRFVMVGEKPA